AGIWPLIIPGCHRLMQSPMDIFTFQVRRDPHTKPLRYFGYDQIIKTADVVNNGHAGDFGFLSYRSVQSSKEFDYSVAFPKWRFQVRQQFYFMTCCKNVSHFRIYHFIILGDCVENQLAVTFVFCTYGNLMQHPFDKRVLLDFFSFFFAVEVLRGGLCGNPIQDVNFIFVARCFDCAVMFGDRFMLGGSLRAVPKRWLTRGSKWNKRNTDQDANLKLVARCSDCAVPPGDKFVLGLRGKMEVLFKLLTSEVVARCFDCFMSTGVIHVVISPENAKVGGEEEEMIIF
ncbi:hypothetical protein AVEN_43320-1, partial [Araneus ventricosus]